MLERDIFIAALETDDPTERAALLEAACQADAGLRGRVDRLLEEHERQESFILDSPPAGVDATTDQPISERAGTVIGPYKLLEQIGEGGFGVVFMAQQERPVSRRVALKVIKPGMDTRQVIARFEAERQALAMMDHPNIAKVLDAGATESGRPFFAMELVRGIPLTKFCDDSLLTVHQRLELFITVCHAVQHAHQKGIIHRDIKPTNVLVTLHDGRPVAKVIDFGVAKATGQRLTERTLFTAFAQMVGTPLYMSPEQAEMSGLDIDTRSDIYSLGVMLYELLTGTTPFDEGRLRKAAYDEIRRIIRHEDPPKPSTRISTLGQAATTISTQRQSEPDKLRRLMRGDLDWIVMKCLEKDRSRRYATANDLAADVKRHLENEPVTARPPSTAYRLRKSWQRNKVVYTTAATILLAVATGLALATVGWRLALTQRDAAVLARAGEESQRKQAEANEEKAVQQQQRAVLAGQETRRRAYAAEMNVAFQALAENNLTRAIELLDRQWPKPGEEDLRGFEWRLLWQLCQSDAKASFESNLAISPDGRWLACSGDQIVIRHLQSRDVVDTIPDAATSLAFSPDGKWLASGHDAQVTIWSTETWQKVESLADAGDPAAFSPDGKWLVTDNGSGNQVWETETWNQKQQLPNARYAAVFSPDGKWFVAAVPGGYQVWDAQTWESQRFCAGEPKLTWLVAYAVAFSPDGKLLVTAANPDSSHQFEVRDIPSLTVRSKFALNSGRLTSTAFAPDGKHLLTGRDDGALLVWDVTDGRVVEELKEHTGWITNIRYAPDGRTFVTSSCDRTLIIWDAVERKKLAQLRGHLGEVWWVAWSPDSGMLASNSRDGTTKLWHATTRHEQREVKDAFLATGFSSDSRLLVVDGFEDSKLWDLADGEITTVPIEKYAELHVPEFGRGLPTRRDVSGIEPKAVYGRGDGMVELWNLATMSRTSSWRAHEGEVTAAIFSPDGQFIATSGASGEVILWQTATRREVRRLEALGRQLRCLKFSPDGRLLAGAEQIELQPARVGIWDLDSGRLLWEPDLHGIGVHSIAFSPDGKLLAAAEKNNTVQLWDAATGKHRATLMGHIMAAMGIAFSPDGKTLASSGDDGKVKFWNIATEQEVATLKLPGGCWSLNFSADGRTLAAGYFLEPDSYIRLWEVPSFDEIAAAEARRKSLNAAAMNTLREEL